jgi:hypothetical protein
MKGASELIRGVLYKKDISQARLAEMLGDSPQNFGRKLRSDDMPLSLIIEISKKLDHNFLYDIAREIKVKFDTGGKADMSLDEFLELKIENILNKKSNAKNYTTRATGTSGTFSLNEP